MVLTPTPKADNLNDHFGSYAPNSHYGPQPTLIHQKVMVKNLNGDDEERTIVKVAHTPIGYSNFQI